MKGRLIYGVATLGEGKYSSYGGNGKNSKIYDCWHGMIQRCYDEKFHKRRPSYIDCFVCDDWLNFQNFAEWAINNGYKPGLQLDKDINGNGKLYSPDNCMFVTNAQNNHALTKRVRSNNKSGVNGVGFHKGRGKWRARITIYGKVSNLGWFNTFEEAKEARLKAEKEITIL